ncbi:hypothetical protein Moror_9150 [Moniliophthora roreri MCA 2997]|uniref:Uncharacterized protein n=1 Tax=Moniliophthora roreri (strain MCA 2997) TaxID=1381753 RepID=V2WKZ5_MONRO|nr:hypothetical protein Moror_9150 [Moniliophthora roreri MCA 2997]KAI3615911.1 hypothetical protein WG66_010406 [Moniliophthora roreri]
MPSFPRSPPRTALDVPIPIRSYRRAEDPRRLFNVEANKEIRKKNQDWKLCTIQHAIDPQNPKGSEVTISTLEMVEVRKSKVLWEQFKGVIPIHWLKWAEGKIEKKRSSRQS